MDPVAPWTVDGPPLAAAAPVRVQFDRVHILRALDFWAAFLGASWAFGLGALNPVAGTSPVHGEPKPAAMHLLPVNRVSGAAQVQFMVSLSRPRSIYFRGSDGARYRFLAKPKDDLRRDLRVMEYARLVNRLFADDATTATRRVHVRSPRYRRAGGHLSCAASHMHPSS